METCGISSNLDESENIEKKCKISRIKNYSSQIYATCVTNVLKFTVGAYIGFTSVLVAELHKEDAEIYMSANDLGWFSSKLFMGPVSDLVLGTLAQCVGSRLTMLISAASFVVSFLMFYLATNATTLLATQAIAGLFFVILHGPGMTYVSEIAQPQLRSALVASATLTSIIGAFLIVFLSNFLHWRTIALVMLLFPITGFLALFTIPESPHWLASRNEFDKAEAALRWLRGWSCSESVASEFNQLKETYTKSSCDSNWSQTKGSISLNRLTFFKHISFYVPLLLMCPLYTLLTCIGSTIYITYCIVIFREINAPLDPHVAASIFDAMRIVGALVCILSIHYTAALWLKEYQFYPVTCQWIAAIAMMFTTFFTAAGIDKVAYILNAEIFPSAYRNFGAGIGLFMSSILQAASNKLFLPLREVLSLSGVFLIFGISCIITGIMFHFMFPETEGKTLQEIEERYQAVKKLKTKESVI